MRGYTIPFADEDILFGESIEDIWYVPYKHYNLTRIRAWSSSDIFTGFEVTYEVSNATKYIGWPPYKHLFGTAS